MPIAPKGFLGSNPFLQAALVNEPTLRKGVSRFMQLFGLKPPSRLVSPRELMQLFTGDFPQPPKRGK